jgi:Fe-S cluster assembly protein SufB
MLYWQCYMDFAYGLTEEIVRDISAKKNEPEWMLDKRLAAFLLYAATPLPSFGPSLENLDLDNIVYFKDPSVAETDSWDEVPADIKQVYLDLGIPQAEHEYLGGVGAQYDSGMVYHRIKDSLAKQGVVFENMDVAVQKYPELVQKYFMNDCVPASDHKFTMLHGAVWSGGTFIYIPKGVKVSMPLQAYFRMNAPSSGQFEHTLIIADEGSEISYIEGCSAPKYTSSSLHAGCVEVFVHKGAKAQYSSIENWSKNTYNLNTKKALVYENGKVEWLSGNMGSCVTMLYPSSILLEHGATSEALGIVLAGEGQIQDVGAKVLHLAPHTHSIIRSKSISQSDGTAIYRGFVHIAKNAEHSTSHIECDGILLGATSLAYTIPVTKQSNSTSQITHEASTGKLNQEALTYLLARGYTNDESVRILVGGFVGDIFKKLPLEYAIELNKLIDLEIKGF